MPATVTQRPPANPRAQSDETASARRSPVVICAIEAPAADEPLVMFAAGLVERLGGKLVLLHVQPPPLLASEPQITYAVPRLDPRRDAREAARQLAELAARTGVAATTKLRLQFGAPEQVLLAAAREEAASLVVASSRSDARAGCAGAAARLVSRAPCPVILLGPRGRAERAGTPSDFWGQHPMAAEIAAGEADFVITNEGENVTDSIVCGIDGSPDARAALRVAAKLSGRLGLRLVVAHILQMAELGSPGFSPAGRMPVMTAVDAQIDAGEQLLEQILREEDLADVERRVAYGFPAEGLADLADEQHAEMIVVGSRGRGAFKAAFLGSVSTELIGVARCPVLVVPAGATVQAEE